MLIFTKEQMQQGQEKAKMLREKGQAIYRTDFTDDEYWVLLAKQYGVLLPKWYVAPDVSKMRSWLRRLKVSEKVYKEACGEGWVLEDFARLNPDFPLRAFVGNLLEYVDEISKAKEVTKFHTK